MFYEVFPNIHGFSANRISGFRALFPRPFVEVTMDVFLSPVNGYVDSMRPVEKIIRQIVKVVTIQAEYLQLRKVFEDVFF